MWGAARWRNKELISSLLKEMVRQPQKNLWNFDQILLHRIVWPKVLDNIVSMPHELVSHQDNNDDNNITGIMHTNNIKINIVKYVYFLISQASLLLSLSLFLSL